MAINHYNFSTQTAGARAGSVNAHLELRARPTQNLSTICKSHAGSFNRSRLACILESNGWFIAPRHTRVKEIMRITANQKVAGGIQSTCEQRAVLPMYASQRENQ